MDVETAMSDALNLSLPQREKIFSGKPIVLKRTSDKAAALSLGQQLKAFGADIRIKIEQDDAVKSTQGSKEAEQVDTPAIPHELRLDAVSDAGRSTPQGATKIQEALALLRKRGLSLRLRRLLNHPLLISPT